MDGPVRPTHGPSRPTTDGGERPPSIEEGIGIAAKGCFGAWGTCLGCGVLFIVVSIIFGLVGGGFETLAGKFGPFGALVIVGIIIAVIWSLCRKKPGGGTSR